MSTLRFGGVAATLEAIREKVVDEMRHRLEERRGQGRNDLPDEEIESLARIAGMLARTAAADGIAEAYQMGVNRNASPEEHERPTTPVPSQKNIPLRSK